MKNQKGFTLIELAVVISIMSIISVGFIRWTQDMGRDAQAAVFKSRIESVAVAIDKYYIHQVTVAGADPLGIGAFPDSIATLKSLGFIDACNAADAQNGLCIDYSVLPFSSVAGGQPISLTASISGGVDPVVDLGFPLSVVTDDRLKGSIIASLSTVPGFTINAADDVVIRLRRPGQLAQLDSQLNRDGTEEMLADWYTGTHNITVGGDLESANLTSGDVTADGWINVSGDATFEGNAHVFGDLTVDGELEMDGDLDLKGNDIYNARYLFDVEDIVVKGFNDRTLVSGMRSTGSKTISNSGGEFVGFPQCPAGYYPHIEIGIISVGLGTVLLEPSNQQAWFSTGSTGWRLHFRVNVRNNLTSTSRSWVYEGQMSYTTWCDHYAQ